MRLANRGHGIGLGSRPSRRHIDDGARIDIDYNRDENQINYSTASWSGGSTEALGDEIEDCFDAAGVEVRQRSDGRRGVDITDDRYQNDTVEY